MKTVIKRERVREGEVDTRLATAEVQATARDGRATAQPGVRLIRVAGRVEALEVTCRCGDVSVVEIEYEGESQVEETS